MDIIESNPDKPWDWECISENPNITFEFVKKHIDKPWDWGAISHNCLWYSENHAFWYHNNRKSETIENTEKIKEELLSVAYEPSRYKMWCLTKDEQEELDKRWE